MSLDSIVHVTISAATTTPTRVGFGRALISTYDVPFTTRTKIYGSLAEMTAAGFESTHPAFKAARALFSANPRPTDVMIGSELGREEEVITLTLAGEHQFSHKYTVYVNGLEASYMSAADDTLAEICTGLASAITTLAIDDVSASGASGTSVVITGAEKETYFWVETKVSSNEEIVQTNSTPNGTTPGIEDDIAAYCLENNDWYCLVLTNPSSAVIQAAEATIEALNKIMVYDTADDACYDLGGVSTTDVLYESMAYARSMGMYHSKAFDEFPAAAWVGKCLPKDPGSITWKFKTLAGITPDVFVTADMTAIEGKNGNYYVTIAGEDTTLNGMTGAGEWLDITQSLDFLTARFQEYVFAQLKGADKIPYTDAGVAVIEGAVRAVLALGEGQDMLVKGMSTVVVPLVANVDSADKADRILRNVQFSAQFAGAIHEVFITGSVTV